MSFWVKKWLFASFRSKIWPCQLRRQPGFPIRWVGYISTIGWCLRLIFDDFVHNFYFTLWPSVGVRTFLPLAVSDELSLLCPTHVPIFSILGLSVPELRVIDSSDHITITRNVHCACAVSRDLITEGGKMILIFEIPDPNLPIHFVTFRALRLRLSHVIGE